MAIRPSRQTTQNQQDQEDEKKHLHKTFPFNGGLCQKKADVMKRPRGDQSRRLTRKRVSRQLAGLPFI
jgi:hypothetical protein